MKRKLREWWGRYAFPEFIAIIILLVSANVLHLFIGSIVIVAFIVPWLENVGFYGTIIARDIKARKKKNGKITFKEVLKQIRNSIVEFGPAEYLDSFVIRPFWLILFPFLIPNNYVLATFIAGMVANITYYVPVIISYEMRKKAFKD